jgi:hypothetical protein
MNTNEHEWGGLVEQREEILAPVFPEFSRAASPRNGFT